MAGAVFGAKIMQKCTKRVIVMPEQIIIYRPSGSAGIHD